MTGNTGNVVIVELKRDAAAGRSSLISALAHFGVHPFGFSKYCLGRALIETGLKRKSHRGQTRNGGLMSR